MPCSPGMTACAASCMHRSRVMDYRAERQRQQDVLYEKANGYPTEITDLERQARENSPWRTPYITFKQHLVQTAIPPEMREMPEPTTLQTGERFLRFDNDVQANEAYLLATALAGERGVEALRVIGPEEFFYPEHQNIAKAIVDLADAGRPHDAAAVTAELRERPLLDMVATPINHRLQQERFLLNAMGGNERDLATLLRMDIDRFDPDLRLVGQMVQDYASLGMPTDAVNIQKHLDMEGLGGKVPTFTQETKRASQLPRHLDPAAVTGRQVDPSAYGLGAWETHSPLPSLAPHFAQNVRSAYRQRYLVDGLERLTQQAKGSLTWDHTGSVDQDLLGMVREQAAYHLMDMPPMLDHNLSPVKSPDRDQSVNTWQQRVTSTRAVIVDPTPPGLNLPPLTPPDLSPAGRAVLHQNRS